MTFGMRLITQSTLRLAGVASLLITLSATAPQSPAPIPASQGESPTAWINPEVRLRKLHLVRPDLIPYPIMFEVYC